MVNPVVQKHPHGCAVACVAMITGESYEDALRWFSHDDWDRKGIDYFGLDIVLANAGYATARRFMKNKDYPFPVEPFGRVHICLVYGFTTTHAHYIVMTEDGRLVDPHDGTISALGERFEDWAFEWIAAIVPVDAP